MTGRSATPVLFDCILVRLSLLYYSLAYLDGGSRLGSSVASRYIKIFFL